MINQLPALIASQAKKYGNREAWRVRDYAQNRWISTSWSDVAEIVPSVANAFDILGISEHDNLAIFSQNLPECIITDFAAFYNRAIPVPVYATSSPNEVKYIINDASIKFVFVGGQQQYDVAYSIIDQCNDSFKIIAFKDDIIFDKSDSTSIKWSKIVEMGNNADASVKEAVNARLNSASDQDLATLIYTSGTTGEPKGVMLTHHNYDVAMRLHHERLTMVKDTDISLSFLPMTHIFERAWVYFCLHSGMIIAINTDTKDIQNTIKEVRPSMMCAVPRFWEKVYAGIQENITKMSKAKKLLVNRAFKVGYHRNLKYVRLQKKVPWLLELQYKLFDKLVFTTIRNTIGIENGKLFPTAGAALSDKINEFLHSCGINIVSGYGLSETTATVSCFDSFNWRIGSVGTTLSEIQVKIDTNNEILVKSETVMKGYYNKPEENAKVFTEDGWFRTGDAGFIDTDGALTITERLKDLFKTSNGKYIAPQLLETRLGEDKYIDQVAIIGDQRKYVTAIVIPAYEALKEYASKKKIQYHNIEELVHNSDIYELISSRINEAQKNLASFEQIKRFTILPKAFSMENGELTNTLKIKRPIINKLYRKEIEAMYI